MTAKMPSKTPPGNSCTTLLDGYSEATFDSSARAQFITGVAVAGGFQV
jgi:hypothetical protein